ncbi:MAG TPA: excinuclease ABC subunit UvrA, partial [Bacillota bacterium]|nr:excinuclease ABC subunit UvrA [Bacillota bacterium]
IPRDKLVVFTGLSGSGKSSLAFDTIYAEGHRRFVESLSSYARMFLGQLDKPDVDTIEGLSPCISIDQKSTSRNPRSTVGTVTEIYDYLRLLYARTGTPHCPICHKEIVQQSVDEIVNDVLLLPDGTKFLVLAPMISGKKGTHEKIFEDARRSGYQRVRVDGMIYDLDDTAELDKNKKHTVEIVIDRLVMKRETLRTRLTDSLETALRLADGTATVSLPDGEITDGALTFECEKTFSQNYACREHGVSIGELTPRMFSFNSPFGACPGCDGLGEKYVLSPEKIIPDRSLSLSQGAVVVNGFRSLDKSSYSGKWFDKIGEFYGFDVDTPIEDMSEKAYTVLMYGNSGAHGVKRSCAQEPLFEGVIETIERRIHQSEENSSSQEYYESFMDSIPCPECKGKRLKNESLAVTVGGLNIAELTDMSVKKAIEFFRTLELTETKKIIARDILKEIMSRLNFLSSVGLDYLTLSRKAGSLSGGEAQRIRLATQIGSSLIGVLYILDEPSIGLHQRDNIKLINTLKKLRDIGNSVIVVEHDTETILAADYIVDVGPYAGIHGGQITAVGTPEQLMHNPASLTGKYLSGELEIAVPSERRAGNGKYITVRGASENNLKNIDVRFPLGKLICVTGVSGSGKSSLVNSILYRTVNRAIFRAKAKPGRCDGVDGIENIDKVIAIDQSPIGKTPRSNPATYTGMFNDIRSLFASLPEAKRRGYSEGRFSFNIRGGRCEACQGDGTIMIEMHFLPDVYVTCDVCRGKKYNRETLEVRYKDKSIYDVLEMTVDEGLVFFENLPKIRRRLETLSQVGLGYIKIGQSSTTLSGGEAQRIKLAAELSKRSTGKTLYILDEPTTGLHSYDVDNLKNVLMRLVDAGNTVVVIEHNLDLIKVADHIIDLGPEGGDGGGEIIAEGTPEQVAQCKRSYTGQYLKPLLAGSQGKNNG